MGSSLLKQRNAIICHMHITIQVQPSVAGNLESRLAMLSKFGGVAHPHSYTNHSDIIQSLGVFELMRVDSELTMMANLQQRKNTKLVSLRSRAMIWKP